MRRSIVAVVTASALLVAACGSDEDEDSGSGDTVAEGEESSADTEAENEPADTEPEEAPADDEPADTEAEEAPADDEPADTEAEEAPADDEPAEEQPADASGITFDDVGRMVPAECSGDGNVASEADGVTEDTVNISTITIDFAALAEIGFSASDRDPNEIAAVFYEEINENGGICGRTIDQQDVSFNILAAEAGQACVEATEDRANLLVSTSSFSEYQCLADAGVPSIVSNDDITTDLMAATNGLMYNRAPSLEDQYVATVQAADELGLLEGNVGVWYGSIYPSQGQAAEDIVLPMLDEMGVEYTAFRTDYTGPSDPAGNQALTAAATEFVGQNVDVLLNLSSNTNDVGMITELDAQGLSPAYFSAPISGNTAVELFMDRFGVADAGDGRQLASYSYARTDMDDSDPISASCHEIWTRRTGETVETNTFDYATIADACVHVDQIAAALSLAGAELNRESIIEAIGQLPAHRMPSNLGEISWGPDDRFGGGVFSVLTYDGSTNTMATSEDTFEV